MAGETVEKRLKDYKGYQIWKITDNKNTREEKTIYTATTQEGDNANCGKTLKEIKDWIDVYTKNGYCEVSTEENTYLITEQM